MAFHPRMTRPGLRVTLAALEAYLTHLSAEDEERKHANNVIRELHYQWSCTNKQNTTAGAQSNRTQGEKKQ